MKKIKLYIATSIDGYIARNDGDLDWLTEYPNPEKTDYEYQSFFNSVDTVIIGGRTFRDILCMDVVWPYKDKTTYVISRNPSIQKDNIHFISQNIVETVSQLREAEGKDIWLVGGGEIISMLLNHDLIDEMIIITIPFLLGNGISLFSEISKESKWEATAFQKYTNGVTQVHYKKK
ncbi:dihydrofolate reductase family protein [Proteiniphilum sp. UBA5384]|uniref:dihydrofolate reductase family protein n=1 Tax=Proteiniphilum sp. UBA5384 TaxID=1947279 RepID=UPI0025FEB62B|nr:dihydrofolate reductase family protein [Proteiniphilum sp. UBA5384]